jgi:hypothetical protein
MPCEIEAAKNFLTEGYTSFIEYFEYRNKWQAMESLDKKALKLSAYLWNLNQRFEKLQDGISHTGCDLTGVENKAVELLARIIHEHHFSLYTG